MLHLAAGTAINLSPYQPNPEPPHCYCTDSVSWTSPGIVKQDCIGAMNKMYEYEVMPHGTKNFKFMGQGASPIPGLPLMQTPRTYISGE